LKYAEICSVAAGVTSNMISSSNKFYRIASESWGLLMVDGWGSMLLINLLSAH